MVGIILLLLLWTAVPLCAGDKNVAEWTWVHRKNFNENARKKHEQKKRIIFESLHVSPFTQLIVSWNALRPSQGHFCLYVQVRNAQTKEWGMWHHVADWGNDVQKSFLSESDGFSAHFYVRLETDNKKHADAFRLKVESQDGACLSLLHGLSIAISDFNLFKSENYKTVQGLSSIKIDGIPRIAQLALEHEDRQRICSPVSCSMVAQYLTGSYKNPLDFAAFSFDIGLGVYGSWPCNMAHAFEYCNGRFYFFVRRMNSFCDVHKQLVHGFPVVVSVRGTLPGAYKPFPHGHLLVVVGYDSDTQEVLCHDPACESDDAVFKRYPLESFLRAWECSCRLAYVAEPTGSIACKK